MGTGGYGLLGSKRFFGLLLIIIVFVNIIVFRFVTQSDYNEARVKANHIMVFLHSITQRYELFSEGYDIKGYSDVLENNKVLQQYISSDMIVDDKALAKIAFDHYLAGIVVLDDQGRIVGKSCSEAGQMLDNLIDKEGVQEIANFPHKSYMGKVYYQGELYNVAVSARMDEKGYLVSFKKCNAAGYANLTLGDLLEGYNFPLGGAAIIKHNDKLAYQSSSYPEQDVNVQGQSLYQQIKEHPPALGEFRELVTDNGIWYGQISNYKDYQLYLFMPANAVYENRKGTMKAVIMVTLILTLIVIWLTSMVNRNFANQSPEIMNKNPGEAGALVTGDKAGLIKVLMVEDNELNMEIAEFILRNQGLKVLRAFNGEEAVRIFSMSSPGEISLIFMDLSMPVLDGFQAAGQIRQMNRADAKVPIVALSAASKTLVKQEMAAAGIDDFISKPLNVKKMQEAINKYVYRNKRD